MSGIIRLRRYRVLIFFAVVSVLLLFHYSQSRSGGSSLTSNTWLHPEHDRGTHKDDVVGAGTEDDEYVPDTWQANGLNHQAQVVTSTAPLHPTVGGGQPATTPVVPLDDRPWALPTSLVIPLPSSAAPIVSSPRPLVPDEDEDNDITPASPATPAAPEKPSLVLESPESSLVLESPEPAPVTNSLHNGGTVHDEVAAGQPPPPRETEQWIKRPENFPVAPESIIPLPSGRPKQLPTVQYMFGAEDPAARSERHQRQGTVKDAFRHAWEGYRAHAWGHDEVTPVSQSYKDPFGGWAATLVDALDTMVIMDMHQQFTEALTFINDIDFTTTQNQEIPVFETTIRYLGGLLGAYDVSRQKHEMLLTKAKELADVLYNAFDTPNRMPVMYFNWRKSSTEKPHRASMRTVMSEIGSLSVEFTRLAQITGNNSYFDAIQRITDQMEEMQMKTPLPGMWPYVLDASGCKQVVTPPYVPTTTESGEGHAVVGDTGLVHTEGDIAGPFGATQPNVPPPLKAPGAPATPEDAAIVNTVPMGTMSPAPVVPLDTEAPIAVADLWVSAQSAAAVIWESMNSGKAEQTALPIATSKPLLRVSDEDAELNPDARRRVKRDRYQDIDQEDDVHEPIHLPILDDDEDVMGPPGPAITSAATGHVPNSPPIVPIAVPSPVDGKLGFAPPAGMTALPKPATLVEEAAFGVQTSPPDPASVLAAVAQGQLPSVKNYQPDHATTRNRPATTASRTSRRCKPTGMQRSAQRGQDKFAYGGMSDSTYEYLIKEYVLLGGLSNQYKTMYLNSYKAARDALFFRPMAPGNPDILVSGEAYRTGTTGTTYQTRFEGEGSHLTCFVGGMVALGAKVLDRPEDLEIAAKLTEGCVWSYKQMVTGIMPETFVLAHCKDEKEHCLYDEMRWYMEVLPPWLGVWDAAAKHGVTLPKPKPTLKKRASLEGDNQVMKRQVENLPVKRVAIEGDEFPAPEGRPVIVEAAEKSILHDDAAEEHNSEFAAVALEGRPITLVEKKRTVLEDDDEEETDEEFPPVAGKPKIVDPIPAGRPRIDLEMDGGFPPVAGKPNVIAPIPGTGTRVAQVVDNGVPAVAGKPNIALTTPPSGAGIEVEEDMGPEDPPAVRPAVVATKPEVVLGAAGRDAVAPVSVQTSTPTSIKFDTVPFQPGAAQSAVNAEADAAAEAYRAARLSSPNNAKAVSQGATGAQSPSPTVPEEEISSPVPVLDAYEQWLESVKKQIAYGKLEPGWTAIKSTAYILRPEAIESVFYMYRITGDKKWQDKGWEMFQAVEKYTKTDIAHSALHDVTNTVPGQTDKMESFWLAETLKYYYLLFSDPNLVSLDDYVLNTEAHPLLRPKPAL